MAKMMSTPFRFGLKNLRWMKVIDVMLKKQKDSAKYTDYELLACLK